MIKIGADRIPHLHDDLLSHSIRVSGLLYKYCNIKDHDPEADILKEFELLLKVDG